MAINKPVYDPKGLTQIHLFLFFAQVLLIGIGIYVISKGTSEFFWILDQWIYWSIPVLIVAMDSLGQWSFNHQFSALATEEDIEEKFLKLVRGHLIQYALVEGATFLAIVIGIVEDNYFFIFLAMFNTLYFYSLKPRIYTYNHDPV